MKTVKQIISTFRLFITVTLISGLLILSFPDTNHAINVGLADGYYDMSMTVTNDPSVPNIVGTMTIAGGNVSDWKFLVDENLFPGTNIRQGFDQCVSNGQIQDQCACESIGPEWTHPRFFITVDDGINNWFYVPVSGPSGGRGSSKYKGTWQATLLPPEIVFVRTLNFIDGWVANGSLAGNGPGKSGPNRLNALINMIKAARDLVEAGDSSEACEQLAAVYKKTDGLTSPESPSDFVKGDSVEELAGMILNLKASLGCQ